MKESSGERGFVRRHARAILASVALVIGFAWVLNSGALPLLPPPGTLDHLGGWQLCLFFLCMVLHFVLRAGRCQLLIAPIAHVPLMRILTINSIALALITFLPLRLGELARPAMLRERGKLSAGAVTGTVGAERILDGVVFSILLLGGLVLAEPRLPVPEAIGELPIPAALVPKAARIAGIVFAVAFVVMLVFYVWRAFSRRVTMALLGWLSVRVAEKLAGIIERISDGLRFLSNVWYALPYIVITLLSVTLNILALLFLAEAVGMPELDVARATVVFGVLALGFALPNAPGFFGAVQLSLYAGLALYVDPLKVVREGAAFVFIFYLTYLGLVVLLAGISLLAEYRSPTETSGLPLSTRTALSNARSEHDV